MKASEVEFVRDKWRESRGGKKVTICRSRVGDRSLQMVIEKGGNAEDTYYFVESRLKLSMRIAGEFDDDEE